MARALVVITPAEGHVNPSLGLVQQLVKQGEEVTYVCTEEYRERIEATGAKVLTYTYDMGSFAEDPVLKPIIYKHPYQFIQFILRGMIKPIIPEVLALTEQDTYDYLIYDYLLGWGGQMIAERLGIPAVCSITSFVFTKPLGSEQKMTAQEEQEMQAIYDSSMEIAKQLADRYQLSVPEISDIFKAYGELKVVHLSRDLQPDAEQLDDSYVFTGSSIVPRMDAPTFKALYYNVPLVMIPLTSDQPMVAQQVQKRGAGVIVDHQSLTPEVLRNALLEVLNHPIYKENARSIGKSLREAGGYERAAEMVMKVVGKTASQPLSTQK
ncbi:glycosyl transferase [Paenibacillus alvei]|uniref:nucleotide disphospho-sugar-binding domain-containing protein n=1 Tax=Paenibacillus alvei TaxID=44250 RepID=UPI00028867D9|nr:nucleotide disphospho-sugar-binding domain-containing protein [Paenibacillus alvei]EJW19232.1 putative macrolide glycosyltransferase [Paenibacillus alvei DSM 29]MCY9542627.1 glycosyl transferase [Paenibacillus alvei]MCY9704897.1 glycosyl transferase [Paenibacillus alvei]MCY9735826.1 glycosyl transferase [Paenibacillus alvei]MCY9756811.1 glycosyl transferase [Paenibacillus alvei]